MRMEARIVDAANVAVEQSIHGARARVSGRDVNVSGLADSAAERDVLLAGLNGIYGRRVVVDELKILGKAEPYRFNGDKTDAGSVYDGNVPRDADRPAFAKFVGTAAAEKLTLAAGAPDHKCRMRRRAGLRRSAR